MAVGTPETPELHPVPGVSIGTACAGIKRWTRDDLVVFALPAGGTCAATFTRNAFCAAPVVVAKTHLPQNPRWLIVNAGNANAGTGAQGMEDALSTCRALAALTGGTEAQVLPFSTGVIGEYLPLDKIAAALPKAVADLAEDHWHKAMHAIMTTDTRPKGASRVIDIDGHSVTVTGIAKGAGMIHPNMATMLSFIATDARIDQPTLQACLSAAVERSFNRITVDGDTSTNDACVLMASGLSSAPVIDQDGPHYAAFAVAVEEVCGQLAAAIVRDGEGASKLMRIQVSGAQDAEEAHRVANTVALSPLVKTAFFASDPNWGRILAAVGRAGCENLDIDRITIDLNGVRIVENGGRASSYTENAGQAAMAPEEITVVIALGRGNADCEVLTCDFSFDYVKINAEYRT
ncbi:MAG: bifunctional glutamate N-acetyltransferase/amino-acid acetyltransferase ArgJ [Methylococcaceae bacterium]|nr:MAG: bifunctional glutamate N-acetyltransferase/amino-acid acetyltransferase ArgJ [Methylococcaceae bacterium]